MNTISAHCERWGGAELITVGVTSTKMAINIGQWVEENKSSFVPPVCNKLM